MIHPLMRRGVLVSPQTILNAAQIDARTFLPWFGDDAVSVKDDAGCTIMHYAACSTVENVKYVYEIAPQLLRTKNMAGETPLMMAARNCVVGYEHETAEVLEYLGKVVRAHLSIYVV